MTRAPSHRDWHLRQLMMFRRPILSTARGCSRGASLKRIARWLRRFILFFRLPKVFVCLSALAGRLSAHSGIAAPVFSSHQPRSMFGD